MPASLPRDPYGRDPYGRDPYGRQQPGPQPVYGPADYEDHAGSRRRPVWPWIVGLFVVLCLGCCVGCLAWVRGLLG